MTDYFKDLISSLYVRPHNKMTGKVRLIGGREEDLPSSIDVHDVYDVSSYFKIRESRFNDITSRLSVVYAGISDLPISAQIRVHDDLSSLLVVRPKNKMTGIVEIIEPPVFVKKISPIKDAFIRTGFPKFNYGTEQDMFVGRTGSGELFRSLIQFNELGIPADKEIKKAEIVIRQLNKHLEQEIAVYEIDQDQEWTETGVTWDNQPTANKLLTTFRSPTNQGEIRIDVTEYVKDWLKGNVKHNGFLLKALDETQYAYKQFGTRESPDYPPYLEVQYFDPTVYSYGRSQIRSTVNVIGAGTSEVPSRINVRPVIWDSDIPASINVNDPRNLPSSIAVNSPQLTSSIRVVFHSEDDVASKVLIRLGGQDQIVGKTVINKPVLPSEVYVKYKHNLESSIFVVHANRQDLISTIKVNRPDISGTINVRPYYDITLTITVRGAVDEDLQGSIAVNSPNLYGSVYVVPYDDLSSSVVARGVQDSDLESVVTINKPDLPSKIFVIPYSDIDSNVKVRVSSKDDLVSGIFVVSNYLRSSITVRVEDEVEIPSLVYVRAVKETDIPSVILPRVIGQDNLESRIAVRTDGAKDLNSKLLPRVRGGADLETTLLVVEANIYFPYAYIM